MTSYPSVFDLTHEAAEVVLARVAGVEVVGAEIVAGLMAIGSAGQASGTLPRRRIGPAD